MATIRLYIEQDLTTGSQFILAKEPAHHLKVLRARTGDALILFNGNGLNYHATVQFNERRAEVSLLREEANLAESALRVTLIQGLCRPDRMDYAIQKSVELGVASIFVVMTARSRVKLPEDRLEKKLQHWKNIIISSCEQSGRSVIPAIHYFREFDSALAATQTATKAATQTATKATAQTATQKSNDGLSHHPTIPLDNAMENRSVNEFDHTQDACHLIALDPNAEKSLQSLDIRQPMPPRGTESTSGSPAIEFKHLSANSHCAVVIGPEAGFSEDEIETIRNSNADMVHIGPRILRTETAGPAILGILQALYGDLST